ncbi:MAG: hypothetical protein ACI9U2_000617 [Bradymonadia bacterium]|jgi:hypothetical protein
MRGGRFPKLALGGYSGSRSFGATVVPDDPLAPEIAAAPAPLHVRELRPAGIAEQSGSGRTHWATGGA